VLLVMCMWSFPMYITYEHVGQLIFLLEGLAEEIVCFGSTS
jgi:hypothetical protein